MHLNYLTFSLLTTLTSWLVGMALHYILRKSDSYNQAVFNLNFIRSKSANRLIGTGLFKWIVKNTFFKYLNQKLNLKASSDKEDLHKLRAEMTNSEIEHLIGFAFVSVFAVIKILQGHYLLALIMTMVNTLLNMYPSLLQQENKRRIDLFLNRMKESSKLS